MRKFAPGAIYALLGIAVSFAAPPSWALKPAQRPRTKRLWVPNQRTRAFAKVVKRYEAEKPLHLPGLNLYIWGEAHLHKTQLELERAFSHWGLPPERSTSLGKHHSQDWSVLRSLQADGFNTLAAQQQEGIDPSQIVGSASDEARQQRELAELAVKKAIADPSSRHIIIGGSGYLLPAVAERLWALRQADRDKYGNLWKQFVGASTTSRGHTMMEELRAKHGWRPDEMFAYVDGGNDLIKVLHDSPIVGLIGARKLHESRLPGLVADGEIPATPEETRLLMVGLGSVNMHTVPHLHQMGYQLAGLDRRAELATYADYLESIGVDDLFDDPKAAFAQKPHVALFATGERPYWDEPLPIQHPLAIGNYASAPELDGVLQGATRIRDPKVDRRWIDPVTGNEDFPDQRILLSSGARARLLRQGLVLHFGDPEPMTEEFGQQERTVALLAVRRAVKLFGSDTLYHKLSDPEDPDDAISPGWQFVADWEAQLREDGRGSPASPIFPGETAPEQPPFSLLTGREKMVRRPRRLFAVGQSVIDRHQPPQRTAEEALLERPQRYAAFAQSLFERHNVDRLAIGGRARILPRDRSSGIAHNPSIMQSTLTRRRRPGLLHRAIDIATWTAQTTAEIQAQRELRQPMPQPLSRANGGPPSRPFASVAPAGSVE